jgi:LPXTG-motif cell wall-anchored protein
VSLSAKQGAGDALGVLVAVHVTPPGGGHPGGTVELSIDGASVGDPVLAADDDLHLTVPLPASGTHTIKAVYSGDSRFAGSSDSTTVTIQGGGSGGSSSLTDLAATGEPVSTLPLGVGGALLLAAGALILLATRRRRDVG